MSTFNRLLRGISVGLAYASLLWEEMKRNQRKGEDFEEKERKNNV
jgi:hypothetical protein